MDLDRFEELMSDDSTAYMPYEKNRIFLGLQIITKYLPNEGIEAADHDIVYSVSAEELVEAGISEKDTIELRKLNWLISEDSLAHFV